MKKTGGLYKVFISGLVYILTGCQTSNIEVKGINSSFNMAQNMTVDQLYEQGKIAFKNNDMIRALKFFKAAYSHAPDALRTLNGLGSVYDNLGRFDLAQGYYDRALGLDPLSRSTLNNLGYSHLLQNKPGVAVDYFRKAQSRISQSSDASDIHVQYNLKIAEYKWEKQMAQLPPIKNKMKKHRPFAVVKVTTRIHQLKTRLVREGDKTADIFEAKRPVGYQLNFTAQQEIYADYVSGTGKTEKRPEALIGSASHTPKEDRLEAAQRLDRKAVVRALPQVEISNGTGRRGMAARMKKYMKTQGVPVQRLTNADHYSHLTSRIFYRPGWEEDVRLLASRLPIAVLWEEVKGQAVDIRLEIGGDLLAYDAELIKKHRRKQ